MLKTTAGQLAVNEGLPEDMRNHARRLDKEGIRALFQEVSEKYPEKYRDIAHSLSHVGYHTSQMTGGFSFDLPHMLQARASVKAQAEIKRHIYNVYANPNLTDDQKEKAVVENLMTRGKPLEEAIFKESMDENNPLAHQVVGAGRGNKTSLKSLRGPDLLYVDHHDRPIPIPILNSYSHGLKPAEYYAGTFGARKGVMNTKFATQDAGYFSKQLIQVAHRLMVSKHDYEGKEDRTHLGLPVETTDPDNEGALLARPVGGYKRDQVLTPAVLAHLHGQGIERLLVRSPLVGGPPDGGVYAKDVGVRERGGIAPVGDFVGIAAAQALSEPLAQAQLSSKHTGGVAGATSKGVSGFKLVNQLFQVPTTFKGGAAHAQVDGKVGSSEPAPQGGTYLNIGDQRHYVGSGYGVTVKPGDTVEAGDVISEGIPNPSEIVKHKGIGEGGRYFTHAFRQAYRESGMPNHRRNIELMARGLINHVRMTDEYEEHIPGDIVPYHRLEHFWKPRPGHEVKEPRYATGMYLEQPVLHYSIGTKIRPSVQKELHGFGIKNITVHKDPPPFEPEMIRGAANIAHDPDWATRFLGSNLEKSLLHGAQRGDVADEGGTSYVPALMHGVNFGKIPPIVPMAIPGKSSGLAS